MIYRVTTEKTVDRVSADGHFINDGGDLIFFIKEDPIVINGTRIPTVMFTVATFAQGYWKSTEIIG